MKLKAIRAIKGKNVIFFPVVLLIIVALAISVSAAITVPDVALGGSKQEKSNPNEDEVAYAETTFTITNTEINTISNIQVASTADSKYEIEFSNVPSTLNAGAQATVTIKAKVPEDFHAVDTDLKETAFEIGKITVTATSGTATVTGESKLTMQVENQLEIKDLDVYVSGKKKSVDDGDDVKDIKPGDDLEVKIEVENKFSRSDDVDMDDVEIKMDVAKSDIDCDEDEDLGTVGSGDEEEETLQCEVDDDADDDDYDVEIEVEGFDDYGARHGEKWNIELKVEREDHEVKITSASVVPQTMSCSRNGEVRAEFENTGRRDERSVAVEFTSADLDINKKFTDIELDRDDSETRSVAFTLADNFPSGSYPILIKTYYRDTHQSDSKSVILEVKKCQIAVEEEEDEEEEKEEEKKTGTKKEEKEDEEDKTTSTDQIVVETLGGQQFQYQPPALPQYVASGEETEKSAWGSTWTWLIIIIEIVVVVVIILFIARFFARPRPPKRGEEF